MGLYENVKEACSRKGISIMALENRLEFPRSSISKWNENIPSIAKVKDVAEALDVSIDVLTKDVVFPKRGDKHA